MAAIVLASACSTETMNGKWTATSELIEGQPADCASAPRIESCIIGDDSALVTLVFPDGQHDVREVAWKWTEAGAELGSSQTWSEWDLVGASLAETRQGLEGWVSWAGWVDCSQRIVMTRDPS